MAKTYTMQHQTSLYYEYNWLESKKSYTLALHAFLQQKFIIQCKLVYTLVYKVGTKTIAFKIKWRF